MEEEEFGRRSKKLEDIDGADKLKRVVMKKVSSFVQGIFGDDANWLFVTKPC